MSQSHLSLVLVISAVSVLANVICAHTSVTAQTDFWEQSGLR